MCACVLTQRSFLLYLKALKGRGVVTCLSHSFLWATKTVRSYSSEVCRPGCSDCGVGFSAVKVGPSVAVSITNTHTESYAQGVEAVCVSSHGSTSILFVPWRVPPILGHVVLSSGLTGVWMQGLTPETQPGVLRASWTPVTLWPPYFTDWSPCPGSFIQPYHHQGFSSHPCLFHS